MDSKEEKKKKVKGFLIQKREEERERVHFVLGLLSVSSIRLPYKDAPLGPSINTTLIFNGKEGGKKDGGEEMVNFL